MEKLEEMLDRVVREYLDKVEALDEVKALLSGEVSREDYARFLKTFYTRTFDLRYDYEVRSP